MPDFRRSRIFLKMFRRVKIAQISPGGGFRGPLSHGIKKSGGKNFSGNFLFSGPKNIPKTTLKSRGRLGARPQAWELRFWVFSWGVGILYYQRMSYCILCWNNTNVSKSLCWTLFLCIFKYGSKPVTALISTQIKFLFRYAIKTNSLAELLWKVCNTLTEPLHFYFIFL